MTVTPYVAALLWGAGVKATINHSASLAKHSYAERVRNIYGEAAKP